MEILLRIRVSLNLLLFITIASCRTVVECEYGKYWDANAEECLRCSPCPEEVIRGESPFFAPLAACKKFISLCPKWCSVETGGLVSNPDVARGACPTTTPSPPVPFVNVTVNEPLYNSSTKTYTASCIMFFSNMDTPTLQWYGLLGQLLAPDDASGKWNVTQGNVTQGVMSTTLLIKDFQEGDEGNYSCSAQGAQSASQTVLLKYVEPPVQSSTQSSTPPSGSSPPNTAKPDESTTQGGFSIPIISVVVPIAVILSCLSCGIAYVCLKQRYRRSQRSRIADLESHPLTGANFVDGLFLETSDFKSGVVWGIQECLDQLNCTAVIIKRNRKKIGKVESSQDRFFIAQVDWNDSIEVWLQYQNGSKKHIKTLKMNCLKIPVSNITETSACITCPSIENQFYLRYEEKNASDGSTSIGQVQLMQGGSKEIRNLRPKMTYYVYLGIRGQTGDSGAYNWVWKDKFTTKSVNFQPVTAGERSATLSLTGRSIPGSMQLYYKINQSPVKQLTSTEIQVSSLIPGMDQVLQIMVKEDVEGSMDFRHLEEIPFKTTGSVENGGEYSRYITTDFPDSDSDSDHYGASGPIASHAQRKLPKRTSAQLKCHTGLLEAFHTFRDDRKYTQVYHHTEQSILEAVLDSLLEFLKDFKGIVPDVKPDLGAGGRRKGLEHIEDFMRLFAMQDYTGIFDLLRRFIHRDKVHSAAGVHFAEQLMDAHCNELQTCNICRHAVFLLNQYAKRDTCSTDSQSSVC